jgi:hypothetical protein
MHFSIDEIKAHAIEFEHELGDAVHKFVEKLEEKLHLKKAAAEPAAQVTTSEPEAPAVEAAASAPAPAVEQAAATPSVGDAAQSAPVSQ